MKGEMQHYWQHQIVKTKKEIGERINLTFKTVVSIIDLSPFTALRIKIKLKLGS